MENKFYNRFSAQMVRGFVLGFMLFMGVSAFGQTTYYSGPTSTLASGTNTCLNWGTVAGGPYTTNFSPSNSGTNSNSIVIQTGTSVTSSGGSQYYNNITIEGTGALTIGSTSTFACYGNFSITGAGKFDNSSGNTVRLVMLTDGKTISGTAASGVGGISIGNSSSTNITIKLNANTSIGGRIAVGQSGLTAYNNTLDLNGYNLSAESVTVYLATNAAAPNNVKNNKVKASGVETLTLNSVATGSIIYFDLGTPGTTNKLGILTQNLPSYSLTLGTSAIVGTLNLTDGKIILGANDLTATTISGGSASSYVVTNGAGVLTSPTTASTLKLFPIGSSTTSYDPVEVTPTNDGVNFSASVTAAAPSSVSDNTKMAQRVWNISATGAGSTVMSLTNGGTVYTPTVASMGHYKTSTSSWEEFITGTTYSANKWTATNPSGSFSPFGGGEAGAFNNAVLSVEFTNFQAKTYQKSTLLTWATASEKDNAVFNIEQSTNGTDFQTVGQVKGHGTTTASNSYNYEHTTPSVGINYYRLKQVDFNGTATYSAVRSVLFGKTGLVVKSTLVSDVLDVVTSDDTATPLSIFNTAGQQVFTGKVQGAQRLSVSTLPAGLYIVRTSTGDVARFVKN